MGLGFLCVAACFFFYQSRVFACLINCVLVGTAASVCDVFVNGRLLNFDILLILDYRYWPLVWAICRC